jgi:diguanylate cyclase (GGDEF)-like protein/PAS domain S-box-containing protein
MAFGQIRRVLSVDVRGAHFVAVLFMAPVAALAIAVLREFGLVAQTPIWLIPTILVTGQMATIATAEWWERSRTRLRLHVKIATQGLVVTATIYATGWGPALAVGLVLVGQESLAVAGSSAQRAVLGWNLSCLAGGEALIALGWAPSLISVPEVHGLAVLMGVGIAFSYRSLATALLENEKVAALTSQRERRFRALVQSSQDLVFVVAAGSEITYASPSCAHVLGYEPDGMLGTGRGILVHEDELEELRDTIGRAAEAPGGSAEFSIRIRHADGTWRWIEGVATNLLDDPAVMGMVVNARDITERRLRLDRQAAIAELGRDALRATSLEEVLDAAGAVIVGKIGVRSCEFVGVFDPAEGEQPAAALDASPVVGATPTDQHPLTLRFPIGDPTRPLARIEITAVRTMSDEDRQFVDTVAGVLSSSIVRGRAEDAIRHQALHDPLTGLPNRTLLNDRLQHALGRRSRVGGYVAVMIVDLDGFKNVNDSLGHLAGDALLIAVADRLSTFLRDFDTIARLGGDEFAILVDDLDAPDQAGRVAQRVLDALVAPLQLADRDMAIGASIGIALADRPDTRADQLVSNADAAMYRAKREGKGCYRVFEASMHTAAVERMDLEQALRAAIANNALTLYYQPIVATGTAELRSFEALARWHDPEHGFVPPDTFIPLAEESGLIVELGRAILVEACRQTKIWHTSFPELRPGIAVNVSRIQLAHPGFVHDVAAALREADLDGSSLTLEVTESVLTADSGRIIGVLDDLRRTGVRVAIDDFGTGYSSLAALAELPIDILKIDKSFIDNVTTSDSGRGFVNAIMQLAQTLQLQTTAEGVEEAEQRRALEELGCSHIQGYLFSKPMPAVEARAFLEAGGREIVGHGARSGNT